MRKLILGVLLLAGVLVSSAFATTTDELKVCINDANCITVVDNGAGDTDMGVQNEIIYTNSNFHGWQIRAVVGTSGSPDNINPGLDVSSVTATCINPHGCGTDNLDVLYSDINFTPIPVPAGQWTNSYSSTTTGTKNTSGSTSQNAWVDTSNTIFGRPGGDASPNAGTVGPFTGFGVFANSVMSGPSVGTAPYSLTLEQIFSDNGTQSKSGISFSTDGSISGTVIPEPGTLVLLGTVVLFSASRLRRRRSS